MILGSWQCRAGWSGGSGDQSIFVCDSLVHKGSGEGLWSGGRWPGPRSSATKSPFEVQGPGAGLLSSTPALENLFDIALTACKYEPSHGLMITEPLGNPPGCRAELIELAMEGYDAASLVLCLDSHLETFSVRHGDSVPSLDFILNVHLGNHASHVHLFEGASKQILESRRLDWGGERAASFLQRLLQCKYPQVPPECRLSSIGQCRALLHGACYAAHDYHGLLSRMATREGLLDECVRLSPFHPQVIPQAAQKASNAAEEVSEKRRAQMARMQAAAAARRQALKEATQKQEEQHHQLAPFEEERADEEEEWHLLDHPDDTLTPEQIKAKRRLRLIRASAQARQRAREEAMARQAEEERRAADLETLRMSDLSAWRAKLYAERATLLARIRERQKKRAAHSDRRSAASVKRLRVIVAMASNEDDAELIQEKAKRPGSRKASKDDLKRRPSDEDSFGADDADWNVYHETAIENIEAETSALDTVDMATLDRIEGLLESRDGDHFASVLAEELTPRGFVSAFWNGPGDAANLNSSLFLCTERTRVVEVLFEPSIVGSDRAGLVEAVCAMLKNQHRPPAKVHLAFTGGWANQRGLPERIVQELASHLPQGTITNDRPSILANDHGSGLGAVKSARSIVRDRQEDLAKGTLHQSWYQEHGLERAANLAFISDPLAWQSLFGPAPEDSCHK